MLRNLLPPRELGLVVVSIETFEVACDGEPAAGRVRVIERHRIAARKPAHQIAAAHGPLPATSIGVVSSNIVSILARAPTTADRNFVAALTPA